MNVKNIRALAKKMRRLRHEEHYNQEKWVDKTSCGTAACLAGHAALLAGYKPFLSKNHAGCGEESCCPVLTVDGEKMRRDGEKPLRVDKIAKNFLGLKGLKAKRLFSAYPGDLVCKPGSMEVAFYNAWPAEFVERWRSGNERPSRIAADLLDAIADGKVKL